MTHKVQTTPAQNLIKFLHGIAGISFKAHLTFIQFSATILDIAFIAAEGRQILGLKLKAGPSMVPLHIPTR